jgi:hypothetical protein
MTDISTRECYACGSDKTVQYRQPYGRRQYELWYTNQPTDLVLCNRCYSYHIKNRGHNALVSDSSGGYSDLDEWVRKNRPSL